VDEAAAGSRGVTPHDPGVMYDSLTGLPTRSLLLDRLQQAMMAARRDNASLALLLLNIDRLADLTEALGRDAADQLLLQVAGRLKDALRESDTVARFAEDVFSVLLPRADELGATLAARKVFVALEHPYTIEGNGVAVRANIGIALFPQHGRDATALTQQAGLALNTANREKSAFAVFGSGHEQHRPTHLVLTDELRTAIDYGELLLTYLPKVELKTGITVGVEALVYWDHPQHGFMPPQQFIPLAEQSGLIKPLSLWVLNEALRQCGAWLRAGLDLRVAVNLSARNLHDPQIADTVERALQSNEVPADRLELEIAEGAVMADPIRALKVIGRLHDLGVQVIIDDFGTAYSSLVHLAQLPIDQIKIDRSFVASMTINREDALIARTVIDLGHNFSLSVVAEGVETQDAWEALQQLGCDLAQGYFVGTPLPSQQVIEWSRAAPFQAAARA
jgi:diguanylate cyclase (GGDEF)-like protein